jgi:fibronectin-binding autotransporter adhesin
MTAISRKTQRVGAHNIATPDWSVSVPSPSENTPVASAAVIAPQLYSSVTWKYNLSGTWSNAAYWSGGTVPGAGNNVLLDTVSSRTITFASGVGTIQALTSDTDLLNITGGTLSVLGTATLDAGLTLGSNQNNAGLVLLGPSAVVLGAYNEMPSGTLSLGGTTTLSLMGMANLTGYYGNAEPELDGGALVTSNLTSISNTYAADGPSYAGALFGGGITWTNTGTVFASAAILVGDAAGATAAFINAAGAQFDFTGDVSGIYDNLGDVNSTFSNAGTLAKTGSIGTNNIYASFINAGLVSAATGTIEFDAGGSFGGTLSGAGTIAFGGGTSTLTAGGVLSAANLLIDDGTLTVGNTIALGSQITLTGGGLVLQGATASIAGAFAEAAGATVTLAGTTTLSLSGAVSLIGYYGNPAPEFDGGALVTSNLTSTSNTYAINGSNYAGALFGGGVTWTNTGTVSAAAAILVGDAAGATAAFVNAAGAQFDFTGDATGIYDNLTNASSTFSNAGTLAKTGGTGTTNIYSAFTNTGLVTAATGAIEFDGGGSFGGTLSGAGTIAFGNGDASLNAGSKFTAATLLIDGGTLTTSSGFASTSTVALTSGVLAFQGASDSIAGSLSNASGGTITLAGTTTLSLTGGVTLTGYYNTIDELDGGTLVTSSLTGLFNNYETNGSAYAGVLLGGGITWMNTGTVTAAAAILVGDTAGTTADFVNAATAQFDFVNDVSGIYDNITDAISTFSNAGTLAKTGGTGTSNIYSVFTNTGLVSVAAGTVEFDGGGSFGGTLSGVGTIAFGGGNTTLTTTNTLTVANLLVDGGSLTVANAMSLSGSLFVTAGQLTLDANVTAKGVLLSSSELLVQGSLTTIAGSFSDGSAVAYAGYISIDTASTLSLTGATLFYTLNGVTPDIDGGTVITSGSTTFVSNYAGYPSLVLPDNATWINENTANIDGLIYVGDAEGPAAAIVNTAGEKFIFTNDYGGIANQVGNATSTFTNAGTFAKTGGTSLISVSSSFTNTSTGTVSITSGKGGFDFGGGGSFGGTITGGGTVQFDTGTFLLGGLGVAATMVVEASAATLALSGNTTIAGTFYDSNFGSIGIGGYTLSLTGATNFGGTYGQVYVYGAGTISTAGATTISDYASYYVQLGIYATSIWNNTGTVSDSGLIQLSDGGGAGTITNKVGGTFNFVSDDGNIANGGVLGTFANAGTLSKTGGTTISNIYATIVDTGTLKTTTGTLGRDGGGSLAGTVADSSKILLATGAIFSEGALTIGGGASVINSTTVNAAGTLTLGDTAAKVASFVNDGIYNLSAGAGIAAGTAAANIFTNAAGALLEQTIGTGRSVISANISNASTILAASGTLALTGTISATGVLDIGVGSTLELGANIGTGQSIYFLSNSGTLALDSASTMKDKIAGFTVGTVIDLVNTIATSATLSGASSLILYNGSTSIATLSLTGTHTGDIYSFGSDGRGGTLLSVSSNMSTWKGVNGDWNTATDWNQGVPGQQTNATAVGATAYTLSLAGGETASVNNLTLSNAKATYNFGGAVNLGGTLNFTAGTLDLGGAVYGGTLSASAGGTLDYTSAYMDNVTFVGALNVNAAGESLEIGGALTQTGTGSGTINITGAGSYLSLDDVQSPSDTTINIGNATDYSYLYSNDVSGEGGLLFLDAAIKQVGLYAQLSDDGGNSDGIFNEGTLTATAASGTFNITGNQFENDGTVNLGNSDNLNILSAAVVNTGAITSVGGFLTVNDMQNTGTITVNGGALAIDGALQNSGSITTTNTQLTLNGPITAAQFAALTGGGDSLAIGGIFDNTGATLTIGTGTTLGQISLTSAATIEGGTIIDAGNGLVSNYGTLSDVTYEGTLTLNTSLNIYGSFSALGADASGVGSIIDTGADTEIIFNNTRTLDQVAFSLGNTGGAVSFLSVNDTTGNGATLTLGPNAVITQSGNLAELYYYQANDTIVNEGSIVASAASGNLSIGVGATGTFTNAGVITVSAGDTLLLNTGVAFTNMSGTTLTGGSIAVGAGSLMELANNTTITTDNATITLSGANAQIEALNTTTNAQVTLDQKLTRIGTAGALSVLGGRNFTVAGAFTDGGRLQLGGGTFTAAAGLSVSTASSLSGFGKVAAAVGDTGVITASGGTLSFSAAVTGGGTLSAAAAAVLQLSTGGSLTEALSGAGTLALTGGTAYTVSTGATKNIGTVSVSAGSTLSGGGVFSGGFADGGLIAVTNGTMSFAGVAAGAGVLNITTNALLDLQGGGSFAGGVVGGGTLQLDNAAAFVLASGASLSAAAIHVTSGATLDLATGGALSGTISGAGTLQLDGSMAYSIASGTTLSLGAVTVDTGVALSGTGTITGTISDAGSITASGGSLVLGSVGGTGLLSATNGAVLDLTAGGMLSQQIAGAGTLKLDGATPYTLQNTAGFTIGALLVGSGVNLSGVGTITSAVTDSGIITASGGTLALTGLLTGSGALQIGAGAILDLAAGGTLAEPITGSSGTLELGGSYTQGTAALSVGALIINSGASFSATGSLAYPVIDNGALNASSGTLTLSGALSGTGTLLAAAGAVLDLTQGGVLAETILGAGMLKLDGATPYTLSSSQNVSVTNLSVDTGVTFSGSGTIASAISNVGTLSATSGTLALTGAITGTGPLQVAAGAVLHLTAGGTLNQAVSGAGTLDLGGAYTRGTGALTMAALVVDAGASYAGTGLLSAAIADAGTLNAASATLTLSGVVSGAGTLSAASGATLDLTHGGALTEAVTGAGSLKLDGATPYTLANATVFTVAALAVDAGVTLSGTGKITSAVTDTGKIIASGGTLTLGGPVSGAGLLQTVAGATLDLTAGGTLTNVMSGAGTLEIGGAYTLGATVPNMTGLAIDAAGSVSGNGTLASIVADSGLLSAGTGALKLTKAVSGAGTLSSGAGGTLNLAGGGTFGGTLAGTGTITITTAMSLGGGASLSAANILATASIGAVSGATITENAGSGLALMSMAGQTLQLGSVGTETFINAGTLAATGAGLSNVVASSFTNTGLTSVSGGTLSLLGTVTNSGTLVASGGLLSVSHLLSGTGTLQIGATGTASLLLGAVSGQVVNFEAGSGALDLTGATHFAGLIEDFGASDVIDLVNTAETNFTYSGSILTVLNGSTTVASLHFGGSYTQSSFTVGSDGHSGTAITFG